MAIRTVVAMDWTGTVNQQTIPLPAGARRLLGRPTCPPPCTSVLSADLGFVVMSQPSQPQPQARSPEVIVGFTYEDSDPVQRSDAEQWITANSGTFQLIEQLVA